MSPSRVRWGLTLILIGGVCLAINLGNLSWWVFADLLYLWPVLLIAIGLELILRKSRLWYLSYISSALILGCFLWAVIEDGGIRSRYSSDGDYSDADARLEFHNETAVKVNAEFENGRFYVNSGQGDLLRVSGAGSDSRIGMSSDCSSGRCDVSLKNKERTLFRKARFVSRDNYWKCYVNPAVETSYKLNLDETDLRLFADDLKTSAIDIEAIKSDLLIKLGSAVPRIEIKLSGRSTDVDLVLPDSCGLRIEGAELRQATIESYNLINHGGYYTNALYDVAPVNINVVSTIDNGRTSISSYQKVQPVTGTI